MPLGKLFGGRGNKEEKATQQVVAKPEPEQQPRYQPRKSWSSSGRRTSNDLNVSAPPRIYFGTSPKGFDIREFGRPSLDSTDSSSSRASVDRRVNL